MKFNGHPWQVHYLANFKGHFSWHAHRLVQLSFVVAGALLIGEVEYQFSWQVHYLVKFKCHVSWQVHYLVRFGMIGGARNVVIFNRDAGGEREK